MTSGISSIGGSNYLMQSGGMRERGAKMFDKIDSNGDGGIDQNELEILAERISSRTGNSINVEDAISTYDTGGDGVLNKEEMRSFMKNNAPGKGGSNDMMQSVSMQERGAGKFDKIDSNGDGGIDQNELEIFAERISLRTGNSINVEDAISTYDTGGDGVLNKEEMRSFMMNNAPRKQEAMSAYRMNIGGDQTTSLLDLLSNDKGDDEDDSSLNIK